MLKKGFTLIELIIVMAILAILATGLLVALDPVEQIRRGSDTNTREQTTEITKAIQRYYAANANNPDPYPWADQLGDVKDLVITNLQSTGELKSTYSAPGILTIRAISNLEGWVCFTIDGPSNSKSIKLDANSKYSDFDGNEACTSGPSGNCSYWCLQP